MAKKKKSTRSARSGASDAPSFEETLASLNTIVQELEGGNLGLADALQYYEQGVKHLKTCYAQLEHAERQIELLSGVDASGNPITEPFDDDAGDSLEEKAASRTRRRSGPAKKRSPRADVDDPRSLF